MRLAARGRTSCLLTYYLRMERGHHTRISWPFTLTAPCTMTSRLGPSRGLLVSPSTLQCVCGLTARMHWRGSCMHPDKNWVASRTRRFNLFHSLTDPRIAAASAPGSAVRPLPPLPSRPTDGNCTSPRITTHLAAVQLQARHSAEADHLITQRLLRGLHCLQREEIHPSRPAAQPGEASIASCWPCWRARC